MTERSRQDSSRDLLEELEDGWGTPRPPPELAPSVEKAAAAHAAIAEDDATSPDLAALDDGWLDEFFPEADEPDEPDEPEPELPDERLDPEAYALAQKARDERAAKKKDRKRAKLDAKRTRQKARAAASRQNQKQKSKKARPAPARRDEPSSKELAAPSSGSLPTVDPKEDAAERAVASPKRGPAPAKPSTAASVKLVAIVLVTLLAIAGAVAALSK